MNNANGSTLLELIAILAIIGTIAAAAIVSPAVLRHTSLQNTTRAIEQQFALYRHAAHRSGCQIDVAFASTTSQIVATSASRAVERPFRKLHQLCADCKILHAKFGTLTEEEHVAHLYPNGIASPGTIIIGQGSNWCKITVSLYGATSSSCA